MQFRIRNCTQHPVVLQRVDGTRVEYPAAETPAWVETTREQTAVVDGIPVYREVYGQVVGLPAPQEGVCLIVPRPVAEPLQGGRDDLLVPTGHVRDQQGRTVAATGLARLDALRHVTQG